MLHIKSAGFYRSYTTNPDGSKNFFGKFDLLEFERYPVTTDVHTLALDFHAVGDLDGYFLIRVWQGADVIHETSLTHIHGQDRGGGGDFGFIVDISSITFPSPGDYRFDIVFNDLVIHSTPLCLAQTSQKKHKHH